MKILHVLWGFSPWREGGLVQYADDLMAAQAAAGHEVAAFFAGRRGFWGKPALARWNRRAVRQYEIRNSPLVHLGIRGTFPVAGELGEPRSEEFFREALDDFAPHVVHIHELAGLPFTLMDIAGERDLPLVLTLHDYFPFCPTLNLFTPQGEYCRDSSGTGCAACCRQGSDGGLSDRLRTVKAAGLSKWLFAAPLLVRYAWDRFSLRGGTSPAELAEVYRQRYHQNVARLRRADIMIAQSRRTGEIYGDLTGRRDIRVAHSTPSHIEKFTARRMEDVLPPVRFATLNGAAALHKGAELLATAVEILKQRGHEGAYRLEVHGGMDRRVRRRLLSFASVRWHGGYHRERLREILAHVDVGIVPSLCEEVYGYVGIEFLANGIPVIGNRRGGIVDYTINGRTGWVNETCTAEELADIMERIINDPRSILPLNRWISDNRGKVIADREEHLGSVVRYYEEAIAAHGGVRGE